MARSKLIAAIVCVLFAVALTALSTTYTWVDVNNGAVGFEADEKIDDTGDTNWDSELEYVYATWDAEKLFIGAEFNDAGNNGYDVWIETDPTSSTLTDASGIGWKKKIGFEGWHPNFALFTWPSSGSWEIGKITSNSNYVNWGGTFTSAHGGWVGFDYDSGTKDGSLGLQFPWSIIGDPIEENLVVRIAVTMTGNEWSAGDVSPEPSTGPAGGSENDVLDFFFELPIDQNGDQVPDTGFAFESLSPSSEVGDWSLY